MQILIFGMEGDKMSDTTKEIIAVLVSVGGTGIALILKEVIKIILIKLNNEKEIKEITR